jgi:hypothetical protein
MNDVDTHILQDAAQELRRVVLRHGRAYDAVRGEGEPSNGKPAA